MTRKIAINGFGRIGRCIVRAMFERGVADVEVVALNDLTSAETLAHLYNYDTVHGAAAHRATAGEGTLVIDGKTIRGWPRRIRPSSPGARWASTSSSSAPASSRTGTRPAPT